MINGKAFYIRPQSKNRSKMKILFIIKGLDNAKGGAERVLADISSGLADRGHKIIILSFDKPGGKSFYPLNPKIHRLSLKIGDVNKKTSAIVILKRILGIRKAISKLAPDTVVAFMHSAFIPASIALIGAGTPLIASEHIVLDHYKKKPLQRVLMFFSFMASSRITVLSRSIAKTYPSFLQKKLIPIGNPVRAAKHLSDPRGEDNNKIILNIGRLTYQKDQKTLIKAFAKLTQDFPDWFLRIVGEGELKNNLHQLILNLKLEKRVFLVGSTSEIEREYQKAQIFAIPSRYESFGLATAEAMMHGLPVIGFSDCPGTNEIIQNNINGLLVDGRQREEGLVLGLRSLMDDPDMRVSLGKRGIDLSKNYSPNKIINEWEDLLNFS